MPDAFGYTQFENVGSPNPWENALSSIQSLQGLQKNYLANQTSTIQNKTLAPTLQAQLQQIQLANQKSQNLMPFVVPDAQAELMGANLTNQRNQATLPYAGPQALASLNQTQAATGLTNQQSRFFPLTTAIAAQNAIDRQNQINQSSSRFGAAFNLKQGLQQMAPAAREAWIAQNQNAYDQMLSGLASGSTQAKTLSVLTPDILKKYGLASESPVPPANAISAQAQNINPSTLFSNDQQTNDLVKKANQMSANKSLTPADINDRFQTGRALENFMNSNSAQESMNIMSQYSGLLGKSQAEIAKRVDPETSSKLQAALESFPNLAAGSAAKLEAYHGTNTAMGKAANLFKLANDNWKKDPVAALDYFKRAYQLFQDETNALQPLAEPLTPVLGQSNTPFGGNTNRISSSYTPPTFKSKSDYDKWVKTAPEPEVESFRNHLSSRGGQ